ncbi:MAG: cation:proton antiporter [Bacteroidota bacterium]|nr:cation:proton antiporter [Bacteroidota bacterium]
MTITIIIILCSLLLLAYFFDLTSSRTKIPSVILLLILGWGTRQLSRLAEFQVPDLSPLLPLFGTIGLVLIVLEGSLELELNKSKLPLLKKSFLLAFISLFTLAFLIAFVFMEYGQFSLKHSLANVIPLCIISSSVAISSVKNISGHDKEFIIYESSMSDILGVVFFNFIVLNDNITLPSFGNFILEIIIICIVSFIATIGLSILLSKIDHPIKFVPIMILVILIYAISEIYHLPALIFILFFGLFLANLDEMKQLKWIKKLRPHELNKEVTRFREILTEGTFLIRAFFFTLFGYSFETREIINTETLGLAVGITSGIFGIRWVILKVSRLPITPLLFIAPRGLITILLFFAVPSAEVIFLVNKSLVIQVIILTALVMMVGLMTTKTKLPKPQIVQGSENTADTLQA